MQYNTAYYLHGEVLHTEHAACGFSAGGKSLGQNIVKRFARIKALLKFIGLVPQLIIGELLVFFVQRQNLFLHRLYALNFLFTVISEQCL